MIEDSCMQKAKTLLEEKAERTCVVLWKDNKREPFLSEDKGIRPLLELLEESPEALKDAYIADKIIGKAAAFLAVYGGAEAVFAKVLSQAAHQVFDAAKVPCEYEKEVPYIINRAGDGRCPMESAVWETEDEKEAYRILKEKQREM